MPKFSIHNFHPNYGTAQNFCKDEQNITVAKLFAISSIMSNIENQRIICDRFLMGRTLGSGMSAKVKLGTDLTTGQKVALKIIDISAANRRQMELLDREINAMKVLSHENILRLLHIEENVPYPTTNGVPKNVMLLVLELAEGGELFDIMMYSGAFSEDVARSYFLQLLNGLGKCHSLGIYHRDIKPENLLLDSGWRLKIADFGLSNMAPSPGALLNTECGTRAYMAPEVLNRESYDGAKADVWSIGVVLFIMLAGNPPFQMANRQDWWFNACFLNRHDRFWAAHLRTAPSFPAGAQSLLNRIFVSDPSLRPTVDQLLQDPWIANGLVLTQAALASDLDGRKKEVVEKQQQEREAAKRKRREHQHQLLQAQAAAAGAAAGAGGGGASNKSNNPFQRAVARRDASEEGEGGGEGGLSLGLLPLLAMEMLPGNRALPPLPKQPQPSSSSSSPSFSSSSSSYYYADPSLEGRALMRVIVKKLTSEAGMAPLNEDGEVAEVAEGEGGQGGEGEGEGATLTVFSLQQPPSDVTFSVGLYRESEEGEGGGGGGGGGGAAGAGAGSYEGAVVVVERTQGDIFFFNQVVLPKILTALSDVLLLSLTPNPTSTPTPTTAGAQINFSAPANGGEVALEASTDLDTLPPLPLPLPQPSALPLPLPLPGVQAKGNLAPETSEVEVSDEIGDLV